MTNGTYAKNNGDGLLCSILYLNIHHLSTRSHRSKHCKCKQAFRVWRESSELFLIFISLSKQNKEVNKTIKSDGVFWFSCISMHVGTQSRRRNKM
jgi:hypothetical protein